MSPPRKLTTRDMMNLIVEFAPALREAGALRVKCEGIEFDLSPASEREAVGVTPDETDAIDPLNDPTTYGIDPRTIDATAPGYRKRRSDEGDIS